MKQSKCVGCRWGTGGHVAALPVPVPLCSVCESAVRPNLEFFTVPSMTAEEVARAVVDFLRGYYLHPPSFLEV